MKKNHMVTTIGRKLEYEAPVVKISCVCVENGFGLSNHGDTPSQGLLGGNESFTGGFSFDGGAFN